MKRLIAVLAATLLTACATPAAAWLRHGTASGGGGGTSPLVTLGAFAPTVNAGSSAGVTVTATVNTLTAANNGSSGDYGYSLRGSLRWDDIPFLEVGSPGVATTRHIGFFPYHPPTDVEKVAGLASNIVSAQVRCDGGAWFTITGPSANPDAGGVTDWNFQVTTGAGVADGLHQCDVIARPATGPDIIAQGPALDDYGNLIETAKANAVTINNGSAGSGSILTVPASPTMYNFNGTNISSNIVSIGQSVSMYGVAANTFIDGNSTTNASACFAETGTNCTGAGRGGTYHVSRPQLVASNPATFGTHRSHYFLTNYNGTLSRPTKFVGLGGADTTGCGTSASPCLTISYAQGRIIAADAAAFHKGKYGGTVCLMGGSGYSYSGTASKPDSSVGWTVIQGADQAPCSLGADPGNPTLTIATGITDRSYYPNRTMWRYMNLAGYNAPTTANGGQGWYLAADHVSAKAATMGSGGLLSTGAEYCVESTSWFGNDGACSGALMVRNTTTKYLVADCQHDVAVAVGNVCDYGGPQFFWATGTSSIGSNVITGVNLVPELAGYTAAQIWTPNPTPGSGTTPPQVGLFAAGLLESSCFPSGPLLYVIAATSTTLSLGDISGTPVNATANCTSGNIGWPGAHGDNYQIVVGNPFSDIYVANNNYALTTGGVQQGLFLETPQISGAYVGNNQFMLNPLNTESALLTKGGNENVIFDNNVFTGGGSMRLDLQQASNGETLIRDQCVGSGTMLPPVIAGTNIRALAATSNGCYSTTTP